MPTNKKKWVAASSIDADIFQLPSKSSKAVSIREPIVKLPVNKTALRTGDTQPLKAVDINSDQQWPSINGTTSEKRRSAEYGGVKIEQPYIDAALPVVAQPILSSSSSNPSSSSTTSGTNNHVRQQSAGTSDKELSHQIVKIKNGQTVAFSRIRSNLDIYALKYVPYWLKAINESFAVTNHAPQIQRFDCDSYRASFAGLHMQQQLPSLELPPTTSTPLQLGTVSTGKYQSYWHERLQNEYAAQEAQNNAYTLYAVDVLPAARIDPSMNIFQFKVPGLRESTPRIDLGDIILIRPFTPTNLHTVAEEAQQWSVGRFGLAPRSTGLEHHAVVWSLLRRDETVLVRLGKPMLRDVKCNVIIPLQIHKNIPAWRAVSVIYRSLVPDNESWLSPMLFPSHGVRQTTLPKGTFSLEWVDTNLNFEQKRAVQAIVDAKYGTIPYLVSGPPGTGKTKTMVETALQLLRNAHGHQAHILVCAPSDAAADTLLTRLTHHLRPHELFRLNNWTRLATEVPGEVGAYCYLDGNQLYSLPDFETMMAFKVVVTTCRDANVLVSSGLCNSDLAYTTLRMLRAISPASAGINPLHWTALILDEAAQATEPEALIPLSVIAPFEDVESQLKLQVPQVIMAGDEYQLGPRLISRAVSGQLGSFDTSGLEKSLFQRLFERPLYAEHPLSRSHGLRPLTREMLPIIRPAFSNLIRNYRSHPAILTTSSALFYSDTLIPEQPETSSAILSWPRWPKPGKSVWPVTFYQNSGADNVESVTEGDGSGSGTLTNIKEAQIALDLVQSLISHVNTSSPSYVQSDHLDAEDVIVMSPFRAQVNLLRRCFREAGYYNIRIGPLDAFQGLESRVVVLCTTRTRLGQHPNPLTKFVNEDKARNLGVIDEPKSFNVAMTRAQEALIVIGNAEVLSVTRDPCWVNFLRFCVRNELCVGQVSWFGKSSNRDGNTQGMGKLERALKYAESLQNSASTHEEAEEQSPYSQNGVVNGALESFRFKLKGTMIDLDERMWEMQVGDDEGEEIRAQEEEDDGIEEADENVDDGFEGVDEYEHENMGVGELVN